MKKNKIPTWVKILAVTLPAVFLSYSCKPEIPEKDTCATKAQAVRDAISPAMTQPDGLRNAYDIALGSQNPQNIADTSRYNRTFINSLAQEGITSKALDNLFDASDLYLCDCAQN